MKNKTQIKKIAERQANIRKLQEVYATDPDFATEMAKTTGAMYLSAHVVDWCEQLIQKQTYGLLIPGSFRAALENLSKACDRMCDEMLRNKLMDIDVVRYREIEDDARCVMDLLRAITGMSWDSFNKVSAYARNLREKERIDSQKSRK